MQRGRPVWDIALGAVLVIVGVVVLGSAVVATALSVLLLGWLAVVGGVAGLVAALYRIRRGGAWSPALGGAVLLAFGIVCLRNPLSAALTLTLIAAALFVVGGVTRIVGAAQDRVHRWPLLVGGVVAVVLGLLVLFNLVSSSIVLLGVLVGVQALVDGVLLLAVGGVRAITRE